jgi:hypothetical protein
MAATRQRNRARLTVTAALLARAWRVIAVVLALVAVAAVWLLILRSLCLWHAM